MTIVIRCTSKLLKLVAGSPTTRSMDPHPADWYGNLLWLDGRKCILLTHASTLFAAFEPDITKAQVTPLGKLATPLIERELEAEGLPRDTFGRLRAQDWLVGRTSDRSVLGSMTDMRHQIEAAVDQSGGLRRFDPVGLNRSLRRIPFSAINYARAIDLARAMPGMGTPVTSSDTAQAASPPSDRIEAVFRRYLADRNRTLSAKDYRNFEAIVGFFKSSLNGYAYEGLFELERKRWEKAFDAGEEDAYCRLFGADKIPGEIGAFVGYFMIRKVLAPKAVIASTGRVMGDLLDWLVGEGLVRAGDIVDAKERAEAAGTDLPLAERLAGLLYQQAEKSTIDVHALADEDYIEDHLTIQKVEPGVLWFEDGIGPVHVGAAASRIARPGWSVNIVLGRVAGRWHVIEVGNVYPD